MRAKMLMVAVAAAWLTLASSAGAGGFECDIPWHSGAVECGDLFSLRPGEFVNIEVLSLKYDDGSDAPGDLNIEIVDANTKKPVTERVPVRAKAVTSYKNETKAEVIGRMNASFHRLRTVHVKGRYTIGH